MESQPEIPIGSILLGKYRVERIIGEGGMGVVMCARHIHLDELVALKFLLPGAAAKPDEIERFLREARAAVRIKGEHVAKVLDVGVGDNAAPYIVMEYLEGEDLGALISSTGALPISTAIDFVLQACEALAEAHSLGIVHRDLKPENLFLTKRPDGTHLVKLLDFGISKLKESAQGRVEPGLTGPDTIFGSPSYMSPESIKSARNADARSDIWSIGVILYQLTTGKLPFILDGGLYNLWSEIIANDPPRPTLLRPEIPLGLEAVILTCMAKEPAQRPQTVASLAQALEPFAPVHARVHIERASRIARSSVPGFPLEVPSEPNLLITNSPVNPPVRAVPLPVSSNPATAVYAPTIVMTPAPSRTPFIVGGIGIALGLAIGTVTALRVARSHAHADDHAQTTTTTLGDSATTSTPLPITTAIVTPSATFAKADAPNIPEPPVTSASAHATASPSGKLKPHASSTAKPAAPPTASAHGDDIEKLFDTRKQ